LKNKGKQAVQEVLCLWDTLQAQEVHVDALEARLLEGTDDINALSEQLQSACTKVSATLGISECNDLRKLLNSTFLRVRMNARALKSQIHDCLRQWKFELERLEHSYLHTVNGMLFTQYFTRF
jgi:hypothetical protein